MPKIPSVTSPDLDTGGTTWSLGKLGGVTRGGGGIESEMRGRRHSGVKKERTQMLPPKVRDEIPAGLFSSWGTQVVSQASVLSPVKLVTSPALPGRGARGVSSLPARPFDRNAVQFGCLPARLPLRSMTFHCLDRHGYSKAKGTVYLSTYLFR